MLARPQIDILVGCETSGIFREAFRALGYNAWSCDLLPADDGSKYHIIGDVQDQFDKGWAGAVLHPTCTRLTNAGVRWLIDPPNTPPDACTDEEAQQWAYLGKDERLTIMWRLLDEGAEFFSACLNAPIPCRAIENPVMHKYAKARIKNYVPFTQSVQPWQFGTITSGPDDQKKRTCWWLVNLPPLKPLGILDGSTAVEGVFLASPSSDRWKVRSQAFPGMATVAAATWGPAIERKVNGLPPVGMLF